MGLKDCRKQVYNPYTHKWENHGENSQWYKDQQRAEKRRDTAIWLNSEEGKKWVQDKKDKGVWHGDMK